MFQKSKVRKISPKEAKELLVKEKNIILLDVRTFEEYREKHIPGSILIPLDTLQAKAKEKLPDKKKVILAYCRSGSRSNLGVEILQDLGYKHVYNLGGILNWPYETESGMEK